MEEDLNEPLLPALPSTEAASEHRHIVNDAGASTPTQSDNLQRVPASQSGKS